MTTSTRLSAMSPSGASPIPAHIRDPRSSPAPHARSRQSDAVLAVWCAPGLGAAAEVDALERAEDLRVSPALVERRDHSAHVAEDVAVHALRQPLALGLCLAS